MITTVSFVIFVIRRWLFPPWGKYGYVYFGSFSRILLPSLRISYMILPRRFVRKYQKNKEMYSPSASKFEQLAFAGYISDGHLRRRIARLKRQYRTSIRSLWKEADRYDLRLLKVEESLTVIISTNRERTRGWLIAFGSRA